jgi:HKD family nuclease
MGSTCTLIGSEAFKTPHVSNETRLGSAPMLSFGPTPAGASHVLTELWAADQQQSAFVAVAFATEAGARTLRDLVHSRDFDAVDKRWLVSIEGGITQPEALTYLAGLPNSEVRVPLGRKTLDSPNLRSPLFFHPKVYAFKGRAHSTLVSSSANLTQGGLRSNVEQFLAWSGTPTDPTSMNFDAWWLPAWTSADIADPGFITAYSEARPTIQPPLDRPGPPGPILEAEPAPSDLKQADWMWIEALRPLEGGSNNQLELFLTGYHFFFDEDEPRRDVRKQLEFVDAADRVYDNPDRIIHFNGPPLMTTGNSMWRIRLPTAHEGLTGYQDGGVVLRFVRTPTPNRFQVEISDVGSAVALDWEQASRKLAGVPGPPPRRMGWS